jgi:hypothetical protein
MGTRRAKALVGGGIAVVVIAIAVVTIVLVTRGGSTTPKATKTTGAGVPLLRRPEIAAADAAHYLTLFTSMKVGTTTSRILGKWPKPYQQFSDQFADQCYEWKSERILYDLCFKHGVLVLKDPSSPPGATG